MSENTNYVERMIEEGHALMDKAEKLQAFMMTETFAVLPDIDQSLLSAQWNAMKAYVDVLSIRVARAIGATSHEQ